VVPKRQDGIKNGEATIDQSSECFAQWYLIMTMAKLVNFSETRAEQILGEMLNQVDVAIAKVGEILPNDFPSHISEPIFQGMQTLARRSGLDQGGDARL
jgi:hypothetical protein